MLHGGEDNVASRSGLRRLGGFWCSCDRLQHFGHGIFNHIGIYDKHYGGRLFWGRARIRA